MKPDIKHIEDQPEFYINEGCYIKEYESGVDGSNVSIALARVPSGVKTKLHRLKGVNERYLLTAGKGKMFVEGLSPEIVSAGDVVMIPAGRGQAIENIGDTDLLFYCICTPPFTPECYEEV